MKKLFFVASVLFIVLFLIAKHSARAQVSFSSSQILKEYIENIPQANNHRYEARDNLGNSLDALKILAVTHASFKYVGVYHWYESASRNFVVKLATSSDLLNWTYVTDLGTPASQPTIASDHQGGFVVIYDADTGYESTLTGEHRGWLLFKHYPTINALLANAASDVFNAPPILGRTHAGTANIYTIVYDGSYDGNILQDDGSISVQNNSTGNLGQNSTIEVGFHYWSLPDNQGIIRDRVGRGYLRNFSEWSEEDETFYNDQLISLGYNGHIGDRESFFFEKNSFVFLEAQRVLDDWRTWDAFLRDSVTHELQKLTIKTHKGSTSFGNPTFTELTLPNGKKGFVVTLFIFGEGAAQGEGGPLIYFREYPSTFVVGDLLKFLNFYSQTESFIAKNFSHNDEKLNMFDATDIIKSAY